MDFDCVMDNTTEIVLTKDEADSLLYAFGWLIYRKLQQTKWVIENKVPENKELLERFVKNYQSILDKIGYVQKEPKNKNKKGETIFSFKKLKPASA